MADRLEQAVSFIGAARSAQDAELRAFYAARARIAIEAAGQELDVLRVNLRGIEDALPKETALQLRD
jgi:hypothetical protein